MQARINDLQEENERLKTKQFSDQFRISDLELELVKGKADEKEKTSTEPKHSAIPADHTSKIFDPDNLFNACLNYTSQSTYVSLTQNLH